MTPLAWTLVHFLWQGAIIGAVALAVLRMRISAPARYGAGVVTLAVLMAAPLVTLAVVARSSNRATASTAQSAQMASALVTSPATSVGRVGGAGADRTIGSKTTRGWSIDRSLPYLLIAWFAGVALLSVRLAVRWWMARRLARRSRATAAAAIQAIAARVAGRLALDRVVQLLESTDVAVPVVIGWLRPVVILPAAAIAGLPPAHIEALLAHELAHVQRHDYLINLLQSVVETLLFYHPAVWLVSREVRIAREQCCDDLAVAVCDRLEYVKALSSLAAMATHPQMALAATDGSLVARVRRLLGRDAVDSRPTTGWAAALAGVLIVGAVPAGIVLTPQQPQAAVVSVQSPVTQAAPVEEPAPVERPQPSAPVEVSAPRDVVAGSSAQTMDPQERSRTEAEKVAEARLKALTAELAKIQEKQMELERTKITRELDDKTKDLESGYLAQKAELERVRRSVELGLANPSQVKELEAGALSLEQAIARTKLERELRVTDFELQIEQAKKMRDMDQLREELSRAAVIREQRLSETTAKMRAAADAKLRTLSVVINGTPRLTLTPAPQPYTSGEPAVYLHLDAASSTATFKDGRIIGGFKFMSWIEGDEYRVMVLALVPRIGQKNAFVNDAKLAEYVDFGTYLVSPGRDVEVPQLNAAGRGTISLRVN